jgi:UDPglucose 6-dehydrogenase
MMKIGIIGNGFVGKATTILKNPEVELKIYDIDPKLCSPVGLTIEDLRDCNLIFISVPTPMRKETGECYLGIVESVVRELREKNIVRESDNQIVIRSTVLPSTCDRLGCYFMPEFLTEKNFMNDFRNCKEWIFGLRDNTDHSADNQIFVDTINRLFKSAKKHNCVISDSTNFVTNKEAEMIKYFRNCFLAMKVSFCNELYDYCQLENINYENVRNLATKDERIGSSHSSVPGHDGSRGYGGTCFPKDTKAMLNSMKQHGMKGYLFEAMDYRNDNLDRPEKDWDHNIGRAVVDK